MFTLDLRQERRAPQVTVEALSRDVKQTLNKLKELLGSPYSPWSLDYKGVVIFFEPAHSIVSLPSVKELYLVGHTQAALRGRELSAMKGALGEERGVQIELRALFDILAVQLADMAKLMKGLRLPNEFRLHWKGVEE